MHLNSPVLLDPRAVSGLTGTISICCWIVVFTPQILANFRRSSADGVSIGFVIIWLVGDLFNVVGSIMQGVLSTMIILAVYYTVADFILLIQCAYYYRKERTTGTASIAPLLSEHDEATNFAIHFNPAAPLFPPPSESSQECDREATRSGSSTAVKSTIINTTAILSVIIAGTIGWVFSPAAPEPSMDFDTLGQIFGYLGAVFYVASRIPQIMLNAKRKSCEGVSMLFFMFACLGNMTFLMSIFTYIPQDGWADGMYAKYLLVNLSWIVGAAGTLLEDLVIFWQFFIYGEVEIVEETIVESDWESDAEDEVYTNGHTNGNTNGGTYGAINGRT